MYGFPFYAQQLSCVFGLVWFCAVLDFLKDPFRVRFFLFVYDKLRGAIRTNYFYYRLRNVILLTITVIMLNISRPRH